MAGKSWRCDLNAPGIALPAHPGLVSTRHDRFSEQGIHS